MAKTVQKLDITEVKVYKCSDGSTFDSYDKAASHETELKEIKEHPELTLQRITELESRVLSLELDVKRLKDKDIIGVINPWLPKHPHPDIGPYQQPFNPTAPTPKLPAQPGDIMYFGNKTKEYKPGDVIYEDKERYQRVVMGEDGEMKIVHTAEDDERAFADGKTVVCAGHNRVVIDGPLPLTEPNPFAPNKQYFDWENDAKSKETKQ